MPRNARLALLVSICLPLLAACGGGGLDAPLEQLRPPVELNLPPQVSVLQPAQVVRRVKGSADAVQIRYTAYDREDAAATDILADVDGDLATTGDQIQVATGLTDASGVEQQVEWDLSQVPPGSYHVIARCQDDLHAPQMATATGLVIVEDAALALDDPVADVAALPDGSFYTAGRVRSGQGYHGTRGSVAKHASDGSILWEVVIGDSDLLSTSGATAISVAAGDDGSCVVTGYYDGRIVLDEGLAPGPQRSGEVVLERPAAHGFGESTFLIRLNPDGRTRWAKSISGSGSAYPSTVIFSRDGFDTHVYLAGGYGYIGDSDTPTVFGQGATITGNSLGADIGGRCYVAAYEGGDGTLRWVRKVNVLPWPDAPVVPGPAFFRPVGLADIAVANDTFLYITGSFRGTATLGAGEQSDTYHDGHTELVAIGQAFDIHYACLDAWNGRLFWARRAGGPDDDMGEGVGAAWSADDFAITGSVRGPGTFGEGELPTPGFAGETQVSTGGDQDVFVAQVARDGRLRWVRVIGEDSTDESGLDVSAFEDGSFAVTGAIVAGRFGEGEVAGPGRAGSTWVAAYFSPAVYDESDMFLALYNADGTLRSARHDGSFWGDAGRRIDIGPEGRIYVAGYCGPDAVFGQSGANEIVLNEPTFVARFNPDGTF